MYEDDSTLPSPASGVGEFYVFDSPVVTTTMPVKDKPGLMGVPLGDDNASFAERSIGYGRLSLNRAGMPDNIMALAASKGVNPMWTEAAIDQMAANYMVRSGEPSIARRKALPLEVDRLTGKAKPGKWCAHNLRYDQASSISTNWHPDYSGATQAALQIFRGLANKARQGSSFDTGQFLKTLEMLQKYFDEVEDRDRKQRQQQAQKERQERDGDKPEDGEEGSELDEKLEEAERGNPFSPEKMDAHKLFRPSAGGNDWGKMETHPLNKPRRYQAALKALRPKPGYVGAFRYVHRALLPSGDGQAFGTKRKAKGGTILLDCSGSMSMNDQMIEQLLTHAPAMTVALYGSHPGTTHTGRLAIAVQDGKGIEWKNFGLREHIGGGNVVDGPALEWLSKMPGPRVWVSDGHVTCQDEGDPSVQMKFELGKLIRKARIRRFGHIEPFVQIMKAQRRIVRR